MRSSVGKLDDRPRGESRTMVRAAYRRGYEIPLLPHQKYGIMSKVLWAGRTQVLRIVPGYDQVTGEVYHQNVNVDTWSEESPQTDYLSDTFRMATVCERFMSINTPFIIDYAPDSMDAQRYGGETVLRNFIRSIIFAVNPGNSKFKERLHPTQDWRNWVGNGPATGVLRFPSESLLFQALVFKVNGENNQDLESDGDLVDQDGDILPLMSVCAITQKASINRLVNALVRPMNRSKGLLDPFTNSELGPMAELDGNELFLNPITETEGGKQRKVLSPSVQEAGQPGWTPIPFPLTEDAVKQLWVPWDNLLNYMTAEEQLRLCARECGADTVNYVIGTNPRFNELPIPDDIRAAGLGRYASQTGGSVTFTTVAPVAPRPAQGFTAGPKVAGLPKPGGLGKPQRSNVERMSDVAQEQGTPFDEVPGVPAASGVDQNALMAQLKKIREASGKAQAQAAADLLGTED